MVDLQIGQLVRLKKTHPCGSDWWKVTRVGADIKIKCEGCQHVVMLPRVKLIKNIKEIKKN